MALDSSVAAVKTSHPKKKSLLMALPIYFSKAKIFVTKNNE
jgi:hypothetical protein